MDPINYNSFGIRIGTVPRGLGLGRIGVFIPIHSNPHFAHSVYLAFEFQFISISNQNKTLYNFLEIVFYGKSIEIETPVMHFPQLELMGCMPGISSKRPQSLTSFASSAMLMGSGREE